MILGLGLTLMGCSSGSDSNSGPTGGPDGSEPDGRTDATSTGGDAGDATTSGEAGDATATSDAGDASTSNDGGDGGDAANDSGGDTGLADAETDADAGACPSSWLVPPSFDPQLDVPEGGVVLLHAAGVGNQIYACIPGDGGAAWVLQGPSATLNDCHGDPIGTHFASEAGAAYPEWQTADGYVIGHKVVGITPDGGSASVPWLLLQAVDAGGALSQVTYVQRLDTDGGLAAGACDAGDMVQVPYTADYFFYRP
jgi:hypothetical protein